MCGDGGALPSLLVAAWHLLLHSSLSCSMCSASPGENACRAQTAHSYFIMGPLPAKRNSVQRDGNERGERQRWRGGDGNERGERERTKIIEDKVGRERGRWK